MDPDTEFYKFLMKTKENLKRLDTGGSESVVSCSDPNENDADELKNDADESVDELENFLSKVKISCSNRLQKEKKCEKIIFEKDQGPLKVINEDFSIPAENTIEANKESFNLHDAELQAEHDFMAKRKIYGEELYQFFNKSIFNNRLPEDMSLMWNGYLQSTAGKTFCKRKSNEYSCHIELSTEVLISFVRLRDTLLHEMCHAACWLVNHSSDKHGPLWRTWASRCSLILPEIEVPARCHKYELEYTYILKCVSCDWVRKRFKMCPKLKRTKCPKCGKATILKTS